MDSTRISQLRQQRLALEARHDEARRSYETLHGQVLEHQARVAWQPEVKQVLESLQKREHERAVGAYEQLLTALLQDVLPGPREVVMDLHSHGGLPALDISLRKGLGQPLEDVLHGTGGSIANVISAGLRAIALLRSGKRKFLVLDEADCWIKPAWAPRFANVINQLAVQMGVQVLMVSHHDETLFPMIAHRLRLERHAQGLSATWSPDAEIPQWEAGQQGIRSITLEDFQSHVLTHLPLGPSVTLLCGDNDIGKSAIVTALRSVFLGEANDTVVRHHQRSARVTIDFGPDHVLRWERHSKGKIKESYRHYREADGVENPMHATNGAKAVPDWVDPTFGIGLIDGLDVQIGHQKDPIFLLNKPSTMRARALAIGQDAGHVQSMMAIDKREITEARASIKQGEKQLERLSRVVQASGLVSARRGEWEKLEAAREQALERASALEALRQLKDRWERACARLSGLEALARPFDAQIPALRTNPQHQALARRWGRAVALGAITRDVEGGRLAPPPTLAAPPLLALRQRWERARRQQAVAQAIQGVPMPRPVEPRPTTQWLALAQRWKRAGRRLEALASLQGHPPPGELPHPAHEQVAELGRRWAQAQAQADKARGQLEQLHAQEQALARDQAMCPQCGQAWSPGHPAGHALAG